MNCDFSSNINNWARFYEFLWWPFWIWLGYFIMTDLLAFRVRVFVSLSELCLLTSDFRLQISGPQISQSPHWAFVVLNRYIFVCQMESHSGCTVHTLTCLSVDLMLYHYSRRWPNIRTTLIQRFAFKKNCNCCNFICSIWKVSTVHTKYTILVQYWATVCDAGPELKHSINVFLSNLETKGWSTSGHRGTLFTLLAMNGESPDMSTIEPILDPIKGLLPCQPKGSICLLKQILPFAFEEQHSAVSAHFTSKQKLPFVIQEYTDPEKSWIYPEEHDGCLRKVIAEYLTTLGIRCPNFRLIG